MKIITKIEIKNFRSFLGTTRSDKAEILNITDLNIFSGSNDSGKSNVLRALNLFFNDEIDHANPFKFSSDFNIFKNDGVQKVIEIKLSFIAKAKKRKFSISKFYNRYGYRNFEYIFEETINNTPEEIRIDSRPDYNKNKYAKRDDILMKEKTYRQNATQFINSIAFSYVPAIREKQFFSHLYGKIIHKMKKNEEKEIEKLLEETRKINNWSKTIKNKSENKKFVQNLNSEEWREERKTKIENAIPNKSKLANAIKQLETEINTVSDNFFSSVEFLRSEFKVDSDLTAFFESFDIGTGEKSLSLRLRGDGLQAKYIPRMLNFIDNISTEKRYFIWGFEEPENSAEYKNQQLFAKNLKDTFSKDKQIFLTTHSEEFLSIYDGKDVARDNRIANLYHVKKNIKDNKNKTDEIQYSTIKQFDVDNQSFDLTEEQSDLEQDIGTSLIRATYSKELAKKQQEFIDEKHSFEKENKALQKKLKSTNKPFLLVEDEINTIYKIAYLKTNCPNETINKNNINHLFDKHSPFEIFSKNGKKELQKMLDQSSIDHLKGRKIIGLFDFDDAYNEFKGLHKSRWSEIEGNAQTCFYRKRISEYCFYSLLLPVTDFRNSYASKELGGQSKLEVELLFTDYFLDSINCKKDEPIAGTNTTRTAFNGKKSAFWEKIIDKNPSNFDSFKPLFSKIGELLNIQN